MNIIFWGTYDKGKPRVRILIRGLQENNVEVTECHSDVWSDIEDKSQISGLLNQALRGLRWLSRYPSLIWRFMRLPKSDVVLVPYMGQLDVLILWPFARIRGVPVVWDAFLSLYNTIVEDRGIVGSRNPLAWLVFFWEWLACKAADLIVLDTRSHAEYFKGTYRLPDKKVCSVFVGAEPEVFEFGTSDQSSTGGGYTVLFYGQFIPLHGIQTIVEAARLVNDENIDWIIIGRGQEQEKIESMLDDVPLPRLSWIPWVEYRSLVDWIEKSDACLGIFGTSDKAARVIPNKVFQIIMAGKPVITMDSPAIRELLDPEMQGVWLVEPGNPQSLLDAVREARSTRVPDNLHDAIKDRILPVTLGFQLLKQIEHKLRTDAH